MMATAEIYGCVGLSIGFDDPEGIISTLKTLI
jgi:hypothetical protein